MYFCSRKRKGVSNIEPSDTAAEEKYSVEMVLNKRIRNNKLEYLLKWNGYDDKYNSWEPVENLHCQNLIKKFEEKLRREDGKKTKKLGRGGRGLKCTVESPQPVSNSIVPICSSLEACRQELKGSEINNIDTGNDNSDSTPTKIPEEIIGADISSGQLVFLMKWKEIENPELILSKEVNLKWPQIVIKFYEKRIKWDFTS